MTNSFNPNSAFVAVDVVVVGPSGQYRAVFAVDTGTTQTAVAQSVLTSVGIDLSAPIRQHQISTGGGMVNLGEFRVHALSALGIPRVPFDVMGVALQSPDFDGLLGLDFFRGTALTIDFRNGTIDVS